MYKNDRTMTTILRKVKPGEKCKIIDFLLADKPISASIKSIVNNNGRVYYEVIDFLGNKYELIRAQFSVHNNKKHVATC